MKKYYKKLKQKGPSVYKAGIIYLENYRVRGYNSVSSSISLFPNNWQEVPEIDYLLQVAKEKYKGDPTVICAYKNCDVKQIQSNTIEIVDRDIFSYSIIDKLEMVVYDHNNKWAEIVEEKKTITDYENDTMMDKKHTIKDLSNGKVACLNDVNVDQLRKVMRAAFPKDTIMPSGADRFYIKCKRNKDEWTGEYDTSLPTVSAEALLKEIENNTTMDKPMTHQEAIERLKKYQEDWSVSTVNPLRTAIDLAIKNMEQCEVYKEPVDMDCVNIERDGWLKEFVTGKFNNEFIVESSRDTFLRYTEARPIKPKVLSFSEWILTNKAGEGCYLSNVDIFHNEYTQYLNDNK
jgi:hypothetical protein